MLKPQHYVQFQGGSWTPEASVHPSAVERGVSPAPVCEGGKGLGAHHALDCVGVGGKNRRGTSTSSYPRTELFI